MSSLKVHFLAKQIEYTGLELSPHWVAQQLGQYGSAIVAFRGACQVNSTEMVDLEDRNQNFHIKSKEMLHFIGEWFEGDLTLAIARQRIFIAGFADLLRNRLSPDLAYKIMRKGNDLYFAEAKLSVSIVTASSVSTLFHFGVNIDAAGAPVHAIGLKDLSVDANSIANEALQLWQSEWDSMIKARAKVAAR